MEPSDLASRTHVIGELSNVVQAMRTLASARRRQAQERLAGLARYAVAAERALEEALALLGPEAPREPSTPSDRRRVVVLFSEHGFVGALNDRLLDLALSQSRSRAAELVAAGNRGMRLCRERGVGATFGGSMPTTLGAVHAVAERLLEDVLLAVTEGGIGEIDLVFAEHRAQVGWEPRTSKLFPPAVIATPGAAARRAPLHTLPPRTLVLHAMEEYAFAQVNWAVSEAFATEQAARFVAMDAARRHIDEKLDELRALGRTLRQEAITSEILEIASGAQLVGGTP